MLKNKIFFIKNHQLKRLIHNDNNDIPIIKIPKYMEKDLKKKIYLEHKKNDEIFEKRKRINRNKVIINENDRKYLNKKFISWTGSKKLYHYYGQRYDHTDNIPLISKLFLKERSNGQHMIIHNLNDNNNSLFIMKNDTNRITFKSLGLNDNIIASINRLNIINPTLIQSSIIPLILNNHNVIFTAETGSGKTIAYLSPIIQLIEKNKILNENKLNKRSPLGMIILPSRELTEQVSSVANKLSENTKVGIATMIGGMPKHITHTGIDLIITTVGLIDKHINNDGIYSLRSLQYIVLDEADTLLDDSFAYETMELLSTLNINREQNDEQKQHTRLNGTQLICSSATIPTTYHSTIGSLLDINLDVDQISTMNTHQLRKNVKHIFYRVNRFDKTIKLMQLLYESRFRKCPVIIFVNRTNAIDWLYNFLNENDFLCTRLTSNMNEEERFNSYKLFKDGHYDIMISTDIASRGLDTNHVEHVINFDCPHYVSDYIHRSGRTGRLLNTSESSKKICTVSTLISYKPDAYMLMQLERSVRLNEQITEVNANIKSQLSQKRHDKLQKIQRNFQ